MSYFARVKALAAVLRSMRPRQWTKNVFVLAALLFSQHLFDGPQIAVAAAAFAIFCLASGAVYLFNDIIDRNRDRQHPVKRLRPVASGELGTGVAATASALGAIGAIAAAAAINFRFAALVAVYLLVQIGYSTAIKHMVILDVFALASGFVIRVIAGAVAIAVEISPWLIICTTLISLFLALCKRRAELTGLADNAASHRKVLADYSPSLLDQMIVIAAAATVVAYALYTMADATVAKFHTTNLIYTVPFVIYGIFRYLYLVHQRSEGGRPEYTLVGDAPLVVAIALYAITAGIIVYR